MDSLRIQAVSRKRITCFFSSCHLWCGQIRSHHAFNLFSSTQRDQFCRYSFGIHPPCPVDGGAKNVYKDLLLDPRVKILLPSLCLKWGRKFLSRIFKLSWKNCLILILLLLSIGFAMTDSEGETLSLLSSLVFTLRKSLIGSIGCRINLLQTQQSTYTLSS